MSVSENNSKLDLVEFSDEVEDLKSEVFGHIIVTNRFGFRAETPVFTVPLDDYYFC